MATPQPFIDDHQIGILFDSPGLTKVGKDGAFDATPGLHSSGELGERNHRDIQLFRKRLEVPGNGRDLLFPVPSFLAYPGGHQLQVIDDHELNFMLGSQAAGLGAEVKNREGGSVIYKEWGLFQGLDLYIELLPFVFLQPAGSKLFRREAGL